MVGGRAGDWELEWEWEWELELELELELEFPFNVVQRLAQQSRKFCFFALSYLYPFKILVTKAAVNFFPPAASRIASKVNRKSQPDFQSLQP